MGIADASAAPAARHHAPPGGAALAIEASGLESGSAPRRRWPGWTWRSPRARCTACSARTARARPPRSGCWPPCCAPTAAGPGCSATTSGRGRRGAAPDRLAGQSATVDEDLTGRENLVLLGRLLGRPPAAGARRRAAGRVRAGGRRRTGRSRPTPGGMRRRLDIAASIVVTPSCLPGRAHHRARPGSRNQVWQIVRSLAAGGATVLLTTQYLDEADQLAGRIAVIDHGTVIAEGTPGQLKASVGAGTLRIRLADPAQRPRPRPVLTRLLGAGPGRDRPGRR